MAPNTSSLFNESSAEASSADSAVMVSKTTAPPADGPSPAAATSAPSAAAATSTTTVSSAPSECRASPPAVVLACRKSCLKRSSSTVDVLSSSSPVPRPPSAVTVGPSPPRSPGRPVQKNRRRCWQCRAKVGLTAVTCRCEYTFCTKHRYAEEHSCSFNFKSAGKRKLEEENPRVVPLKVARIN